MDEILPDRQHLQRVVGAQQIGDGDRSVVFDEGVGQVEVANSRDGTCTVIKSLAQIAYARVTQGIAFQVQVQKAAVAG